MFNLYKIKNLFYANRLRKVSDNLLLKQKQTLLPVKTINGKPEFEVDKVKKFKTYKKHKEL